jgi:hypothetical protein
MRPCVPFPAPQKENKKERKKERKGKKGKEVSFT